MHLQYNHINSLSVQTNPVKQEYTFSIMPIFELL